MKRLQYDRYGGPEVMRLAEFEPPRPGPDEVLVRVRAAASNALDWKMRNGEMKLLTGRSFPRAMGHDFAGVVEAVGAGVTRLKAGDAVLGGARFRQAGAFAEMVTVPEKAVVLKPVDLSYEQAAALPTVGVTAYQATAEVRPGIAGQPLGQTSCNADPQETARNEQLEQKMVVPEIAKAVNTAPEYAPLRQASLARVVAQWIHDRHNSGHATSFDKLLDSGDLGPAVLQGSWRPRQVYDSYLYSIREGDFTYKQTTHAAR